jgi:hypothetical protein
MSHLRLIPSTAATDSEAEREAKIFLHGRELVDASQLADHFTRRGWAMGPRRAGMLLLGMGWTGSTLPGGRRIFRRPSAIAEGRYYHPWLLSAPEDPDTVAARDRRRRWNRAFAIFAIVASVYFLARCLL